MPRGGKTRTSGQGRPKGTPNKHTADLKAMIHGALQDAGGQKYLAEQAKKNPGAFLALVGKTLPRDVVADVNVKGDVKHTVTLVRPNGVVSDP